MMRRWIYGYYELLRITFGAMMVGGCDLLHVARNGKGVFVFCHSCVPSALLSIGRKLLGCVGLGFAGLIRSERRR